MATILTWLVATGGDLLKKLILHPGECPDHHYIESTDSIIVSGVGRISGKEVLSMRVQSVRAKF